MEGGGKVQNEMCRAQVPKYVPVGPMVCGGKDPDVDKQPGLHVIYYRGSAARIPSDTCPQ